MHADLRRRSSACIRGSVPSGREPLEFQAQPETELPLVRFGARYCHEIAHRYVTLGGAKMRRVGEVEYLRAELQREAFLERELAKHRQIKVDHAGCAQGIPPGGSETGFSDR